MYTTSFVHSSLSVFLPLSSPPSLSVSLSKSQRAYLRKMEVSPTGTAATCLLIVILALVLRLLWKLFNWLWLKPKRPEKYGPVHPFYWNHNHACACFSPRLTVEEIHGPTRIRVVHVNKACTSFFLFLGGNKGGSANNVH